MTEPVLSEDALTSVLGFDLQTAYRVSEDVSAHQTKTLFWALDRFDYDRKDIGGDARAQRSEATQRIAKELDRRNIGVRNPILPSSYQPGRGPR